MKKIFSSFLVFSILISSIGLSSTFASGRHRPFYQTPINPNAVSRENSNEVSLPEEGTEEFLDPFVSPSEVDLLLGDPAQLTPSVVPEPPSSSSFPVQTTEQLLDSTPACPDQKPIDLSCNLQPSSKNVPKPFTDSSLITQRPSPQNQSSQNPYSSYDSLSSQSSCDDKDSRFEWYPTSFPKKMQYPSVMDESTQTQPIPESIKNKCLKCGIKILKYCVASSLFAQVVAYFNPSVSFSDMMLSISGAFSTVVAVQYTHNIISFIFKL